MRSGIDMYLAAMLLFEESPSFFDAAGYIAQLSVELLFKSWLLAETGSFPRIHSISKLYKQARCHQFDELSPEELSAIEFLVRRFERKPGAQFEALDCCVYAFAAYAGLRPLWDQRQAELRAGDEPAPKRPAVVRSRWLERAAL